MALTDIPVLQKRLVKTNTELENFVFETKKTNEMVYEKIEDTR